MNRPAITRREARLIDGIKKLIDAYQENPLKADRYEPDCIRFAIARIKEVDPFYSRRAKGV